jgi:hypothetical protein
MQRIRMGKSPIWYGFLDAGKKSSPIVLDTRLETNNPKTIYLFNYARGKILEYSHDIVESKLKELQPDNELLKELKECIQGCPERLCSRAGRS